MTEFMPLLEKQKEYVSIILQLTEKQSRLISELETDELLENIALRQNMIDKLTEVGNELQQLEARNGGYPEETRELYFETRALLEKVGEKDKENEAHAIARRESLKADMRKVAAGKKGNETYERQIGGGASFYFDKRE